MSGKTYMILGGGGSFGIHAALYLLDHGSPNKVIGVGRNPLRPEPFSLNVDKRDGYEYHARHVTYELDLLLELMDREKPEVIVNFDAQGEGAVRSEERRVGQVWVRTLRSRGVADPKKKKNKV